MSDDEIIVVVGLEVYRLSGDAAEKVRRVLDEHTPGGSFASEVESQPSEDVVGDS